MQIPNVSSINQAVYICLLCLFPLIGGSYKDKQYFELAML
jgi:hypothetical protein